MKTTGAENSTRASSWPRQYRFIPPNAGFGMRRRQMPDYEIVTYFRSKASRAITRGERPCYTIYFIFKESFTTLERPLYTIRPFLRAKTAPKSSYFLGN